jgi:hypothetical protein
MSLELFLSVRIRKWRSQYFKPKSALIVSIIAILTIFSLNFGMAVFMVYDKNPNANCFVSDFYTKSMQVSFVI